MTGAPGVAPTQFFARQSQPFVYRFMFGPDWAAGCPHCSFWAGNSNGIIVHPAPKGRDEAGRMGNTRFRVRRHDEYQD